MALELRSLRVPDPSGHGTALRLRGDWVFLLVSDGIHTGLGEASHSGDDRRCIRAADRIFARIVAGLSPSLEEIRTLESGVLSTAADRIEATAASALDRGLRAVKCAPFEAVMAGVDQVRAAGEGLRVLGCCARGFRL